MSNPMTRSNRTYESIDRAKASLGASKTAAAVQGYPPGYITGFTPSVDDFGQLNIGPGAGNIGGRAVNQATTRTVTDGDWAVERLNTLTYYVYIDSTGAYHVDIIAPEFVDTLFGYYHAAQRTWRHIATFDLSSGGDIENVAGGKVYIGDLAAGSVSTAALAADSVTASKILASEIATLLLRATSAVIAGYGGSGTNSAPEEGDRRIYIDDDEIGLQIYTKGAWSTERQIALGGVDGNSNFRPFLACRGMLGDINDAPTLDPIPSASFYRFNWDNVATDQDGTDPWTVNLGTPAYDASVKWEGTHALTEATVTLLNMTWASAWEAGDSVTAAFMYRLPTTVSFGHSLLEWNANNQDDHIFVQLNSDRTITVEINKGGTETSVTSGALSVNAWHFIGITYDSTENKCYVRIDSDESELTPTGSWGSGAKDFYLSLCAPDQQEYMDDLIVSHSEAISADLFFQHVTRAVAWTTEYTASDLVLKPRTGGDVVLDADVRVTGDIDKRWHKVADPTVGWLASKTSGWTEDSFSSGLTVDFSAVVPVGTRAVLVSYRTLTTSGILFWRPGSDANVSNTPSATGEQAYTLNSVAGASHAPAVLWLSAAYTVDFAVTDATQDVYIAYPVGYLL